jgi:hypothetical protein
MTNSISGLIDPTVKAIRDPMLQTSLPSFLAPMLPTLIKEPFDSPDWIFEPKLDGYRAIAVIDATGKPRIWSRELASQRCCWIQMPWSTKSYKGNSHTSAVS